MGWKRVGITVKPGHAGIGALLRRIAAVLLDHGLEFELEPAAAEQAPELAGPESPSREAILSRCDLVVALGGGAVNWSGRDGDLAVQCQEWPPGPAPVLRLEGAAGQQI